MLYTQHDLISAAVAWQRHGWIVRQIFLLSFSDTRYHVIRVMQGLLHNPYEAAFSLASATPADITSDNLTGIDTIYILFQYLH